MADTTDAGREKVLELLPTGLTVLTTALATVGGLTGGIARMFRNNGEWATWTFVGIGVAISLALTARYLGAARHPRWSLGLGLLGIGVFGGSLIAGLWMAVDTARTTDRPTLNAVLEAADADGPDDRWVLQGTASASGLGAADSLQVYVYAYPSDSQDRTQLLQVTAGPNGDGVATQHFEIPAPTSPDFQSIVVTAAVGEKVRFCDGKPLEVGARFGEKQTDDASGMEGNTSCMVLRPPGGR